MEPVAGSMFKSPDEALGMLESAMKYLACVDHAQLGTQEMADVLKAMERVDAAQAAVRGRTVSAFTTARAFSEYAVRGMPRWFVNQTKVTKAAAAAHKAWGTRSERHPVIVEALAEDDVITESWARTVCQWTDALPEDCVQDADLILVAAARAGADLEGLARIAGEIAARTAGPDQDKGTPRDRSLRLQTTFEGAGILAGELSPECAVVVKAVLDALAVRQGPEDLRSHGERYHDALHEAMKRILAGDVLPRKNGKPYTALVHINFADLCARDPRSVLQDRWIRDTRAYWAAERAGASVTPGDGGAWLDGDCATATACDALLVPVVTAIPDVTVLDELVELCVEYDQLHQHGTTGDDGDERVEGTPSDCAARTRVESPAPDEAARATRDRVEVLQKEIIGKAVALMSGPRGLAAFLRRHELGAGLAGPSLPLDVGDTDHIPWQIRRAVALRDRHCAFPGGCDQPAERCEPHHTDPRANHGPTSLYKLGLFCYFHHHIVIHTWGWTVTINPDGTMTARKPDGTIFPSHDPPPRPG